MTHSFPTRRSSDLASLLKDRSFPSIEDLEPADIEDFGPHSELLDFTAGMENPAVAYMGSALRRECDIEEIGRAHAELQSLMRISYAVFRLKKKKTSKT